MAALRYNSAQPFNIHYISIYDTATGVDARFLEDTGWDPNSILFSSDFTKGNSANWDWIKRVV